MWNSIKHYVYIILNLITIYRIVYMYSLFYKNKLILWTKYSVSWGSDLHVNHMSAGQRNLFLEET